MSCSNCGSFDVVKDDVTPDMVFCLECETVWYALEEDEDD